MQDVKSREDIKKIVVLFYDKIRIDTLLGSIFNKMIQDWDKHLEHLTDFWESNVFMVSKYSGNPIQIHQEVDKQAGGVIEQDYFVQWLKLWFETIDSNFVGDNANIMKNRARNMSTYIYIQIWKARQK